jgi:hypothetical protein
MSALDTFYTKDIEISRLAYVGDKGTFGVVETVKGYLRPLDEVQASAQGFQFGQAHALQVPNNIDLREGDTLVIDSETYNVNGVAEHGRLSIAHKRALITKKQTD